jgi:hypothetical protein
MDICLYVISIQLMQKTTRLQQGANIRCKEDVSKGPKTDPWGTPKGAGTQRDLEEPAITQLVRPVRKEESHSRGLPVSPKETERRWVRIEWSTESNAELTSKRAKRVI